MLERQAIIDKREKERVSLLSWQQQLHHLTNGKPKSVPQSPEHNPDLLTPAMRKVMNRRTDRLSIGKANLI